jgi:hypothetical protein
MPFITPFLREDLSPEQIKIAKDTISYFKKMVEDAKKNANNKEEFETKVKYLKEKFYPIVKEYIKENKREEFKKMVESNISYMMQDHMKKDQNNYEDR